VASSRHKPTGQPAAERGARQGDKVLLMPLENQIFPPCGRDDAK
jgi:hypothetical protein